MSIKREIIETAENLAREGAANLTRTIVDEARSRREEPGYWFAHHVHMWRTLPRWRWAARLFHRGQARRYMSHAKAQAKHGGGDR